MDRTTALGAAAGVTLAVVGAVSALFLTIDQPADAAQGETPAVEYVDQYGNPLAASVGAAAAAPDVVLVNPDGTLVDTSASAADAAYGEGEHEEYEEHGEYEEAEHGEDEYEEAEHGEDEYEEEEGAYGEETEHEEDEYDEDEYEDEDDDEDEEDEDDD